MAMLLETFEFPIQISTLRGIPAIITQHPAHIENTKTNSIDDSLSEERKTFCQCDSHKKCLFIFKNQFKRK